MKVSERGQSESELLHSVQETAQTELNGRACVGLCALAGWVQPPMNDSFVLNDFVNGSPTKGDSAGRT